jgi:hypothetical protein
VGRIAALLVVAGALVAWYEIAPHLSGWSTWPAVGLISLVLMPAVFSLTWLALPVWEHPKPLAVSVSVLVVATVVLSELDAPVFANFAKFAAVTGAGLLFLSAFEALWWTVLVACIIPFVDAYSVWRGPTHTITEHHEAVFSRLSVAFVTPGGGAARLGIPDVMFFALFLGASARWGLRTGWTWLCMTAGLGITMALTTQWSTGGLPALPAIALGFLIPNADLIWRNLMEVRRARLEPDADSG